MLKKIWILNSNDDAQPTRMRTWAWVERGLAVSKALRVGNEDPYQWTVTHLNTGLRVTPALEKERAKRVFPELAKLPLGEMNFQEVCGSKNIGKEVKRIFAETNMFLGGGGG